MTPLPERFDVVTRKEDGFRFSVPVWSKSDMLAYGDARAAAERERCARAIEQYGGAWDVTTQNFARVIREQTP